MADSLFQKLFGRSDADDDAAAPASRSSGESTRRGASADPSDADGQDESAQRHIASLLNGDGEPENDDVDLEAIQRAIRSTERAASELDTVRKLTGQDAQPTDEDNAEQANDQEPSSTPAKGLNDLVQDEVVLALLQWGVVSTPQVLLALQQYDAEAGIPLWRVLVEVTDVDRELAFEEAARVLGFEAAPFEEEGYPPAELVQAIVGLFPHEVSERFVHLGVLPFELVIDAEARQHSLRLATHDPSGEPIQAFVRTLGMPVTLYYAPEDEVARQLDHIVSGGADEASAASSDGDDTAVDAGPAESDREETTLEEDADLDWTSFIEDEKDETASNGPVQNQEPHTFAEHAAEEREPASEEQSSVDAHEVAEADRGRTDEQPSRPESHMDPSTSGLSDEELARALDTDTLWDEDVLVDDEMAPADPDTFSGDGHIDQEGPIPVYGSDDAPDNDHADASDEPPLPELSNWMDDDEHAEDESPPAGENGRANAGKAKTTLSDDELEKIKSKDRVVATLLRKDIVAPELVGQAQQKKEREDLKDPLWRVLTRVDGVKRGAVFAEAARVYAFTMAEIGNGKPDPDFARSVMNTFDEKHRDALLDLRVFPFEVDLEQQTGAIKVVFITHDPTRPEIHRMMQRLNLERFELRYAPETTVAALIAETFPRKNEYLERLDEDGSAVDLGTSYNEDDELVDEDVLEAEISRSKLINLFEATLVEAVRQSASDVHIWPNADKKVEIHFRIDGRLRRWHIEDKVHPEALLAVIKDNSMNVDRFERDAAQDGFIQRWIDDALIRFRVSVMPIENAATEVRSESIVIRVLDDRKVIKDLRKLGLQELAFERFQKAINQPHGMVILTGPTGSGKTTTLYAALHEVVSPEVNVLTVEDPVEYILPGVRQIKLNHKLGLEDALRSILRHDPDVVMVGEMRDRKTADLAIKLANTGHLTFSTLHTNDAASAVSRLYKMGIEPFLIAYAINLVVAQRLIRKLCDQCMYVDPDPDPVLLRKLGFSEPEIADTTFYLPGEDDNCPKCKGMGYKGRRAITEALYFSREIRHLIADSQGNLDEQQIKEIALQQGMMTLLDSAREVVKNGETSVQEMLRVVATEE